MKLKFTRLTFFIALSSCLLFANKNYAQNSDVNLFTNNATFYIANVDDIKTIFAKGKNELVNLKIASNVTVKIAINMNVWNDANTQTIGGRLLEYNDAYITITAYTYKGVYYVSGSIIGKAYNKGFAINLNPDGKVHFKKVALTDIIAE